MSKKFFQRQDSRFSLSGVTVASTLCVAIIGVFAICGSAEALPSAPVTQTPPSSVTNSVNKQLLGQWQTKDPEGSPLLVFMFTPEGKLYIMPPFDPELPSRAMEMGYKIDSNQNPMHLDVQLNSKDTVQTVFELTPEGKLRLQLQGTNPGVPRPTILPDNATVFEKISASTTLPPNTEIIKGKG